MWSIDSLEFIETSFVAGTQSISVNVPSMFEKSRRVDVLFLKYKPDLITSSLIASMVFRQKERPP